MIADAREESGGDFCEPGGWHREDPGAWDCRVQGDALALFTLKCSPEVTLIFQPEESQLGGEGRVDLC